MGQLMGGGAVGRGFPDHLPRDGGARQGKQTRWWKAWSSYRNAKFWSKLLRLGVTVTIYSCAIDSCARSAR